MKTPSGVLSTAEAISLLANSMALSGNFGDGTVSDNDLASGLQGAVIKDDEKDIIVWKDYLSNVHEEARRDVARSPHRLPVTRGGVINLTLKCQPPHHTSSVSAIFRRRRRGICGSSWIACARSSC
ncbi:MAG: hypothetical protein WDN00_17645 [Limisphaerales bacterium]